MSTSQLPQLYVPEFIKHVSRDATKPFWFDSTTLNIVYKA